jgi:hypothetical protein
MPEGSGNDGTLYCFEKVMAVSSAMRREFSRTSFRPGKTAAISGALLK